ncbi:MAG: hypothetical protein K2O07_01285, partial [Alistipes sp.]|nr:hypothetical protein [Alistipes sp.]
RRIACFLRFRPQMTRLCVAHIEILCNFAWQSSGVASCVRRKTNGDATLPTTANIAAAAAEPTI